jgi:hypothetical protein
MALVDLPDLGNVFCFATPAAYKPSRVWASHAHGANGFTARDSLTSIAVSTATRARENIRGADFIVEFEIVDYRLPQDTHSYKVQVWYGRKVLLFEQTYRVPGNYQVALPALDAPVLAILQVASIMIIAFPEIIITFSFTKLIYVRFNVENMFCCETKNLLNLLTFYCHCLSSILLFFNRLS